MSKQLNQLRKYHLMTEESMKKLREIEGAEKQFSAIDKRLKRILYNKQLTGYNKFILYSQLFDKFQQLRQEIKKKYIMQSKLPQAAKTTMTSNDLATQTAVTTNEMSTQAENGQNQLNGVINTTPINETISNESATTTTPIADVLVNRSPISQISTPTNFRRPLQFSDETFFTPVANMANPIASQLDAELPNMENLNITEQSTIYDPKWISKLNWNVIDEVGDLDVTPQRRLSAKAIASASKKSAKQKAADSMYNENDGAVGGYSESTEDEQNLTILNPSMNRTPSEYVTVKINEQYYQIPVHERDDFGEFAAEELSKWPNIKKLSNDRFTKWKKRKDKEQESRMREERELQRRVKQREEQEKIAQELKEAESLENTQLKETNWGAPFVEPTQRKGSTSTPKTPSRKASSIPKAKTNNQEERDPDQPSVADLFKKQKQTSSRKQSGHGKMFKRRWIQLK